MPSNASHAIETGKRHSFYLCRLLAATPELERALLRSADQRFDLAAMTTFADWPALATPETLSPVLRDLRQAFMARLIVRDLDGSADLDEVVTGVSELARFCIARAHDVARRSLADYGEPIGEDSGQPQQLIVVGMGKLGGGELNASSDIDLIFVYPENGETNGARRISNHEYFTLLGKALIRLLSDLTDHGQVFRVDMRLRPYGDSGPLAMSFAALENYLLAQGREWERYAWIKARALCGDADGLYELVRPFVYRKYLDYGAYGAMRELHAQIRREVARRDMANNIKLGPGGIREIEFIAQVFQLIRGGRDKSLQLRGTRETLTRLGELRLLEPAAVSELHEAYAFLRRLEHHLQYTDDQQTQTLPDADDALEKLALGLGLSDRPAFEAELARQRQRVTRHFEQVFFLPTDSAPEHPLYAAWRDLTEHDIRPVLASLGYRNPDDVARQLEALAHSQRYRQMPQTNRKQFDALLPPLIEVGSHYPNPDVTLGRIVGLMEAISRRASYLALLSEYPQTLQRLAALCSSSSWVSTYLTRHPILLDELLDARVLYAAPDWPVLAQQLETQLSDRTGDVEGKIDALRHFQHAQAFRLVAQDLAGMWTLEALSDELSRLADAVLAATLRHAWLDIPNRDSDTPRFAIVGYGKLGGKELGYASDLDLIFLYDDPSPDAAEIYSRLARKMIAWLTSATAAGRLYDIDLRLRPNGSSGLLVSSVQAFERYQRLDAWAWEHQALTRARFIAGDPAIGERFTAIRYAILTQPRDVATLRAAVRDMRQRMLESHPALEHDVKHARGGIVDIEFIMQYLILGHAAQLPALTANSGTIALLACAAEAGLIPNDLARGCRDTYRQLRRLQHAARLNDADRVEVDDTLRECYQAGQQLWHALLETE